MAVAAAAAAVANNFSPSRRGSLRSFDVPVFGSVKMVSMGRLESPPLLEDTSNEADVTPCDSSLTSSSIQAVDSTSEPAPLRPNSDAQGYLHHKSKVEYGMKLGYTESEVQTALVKLGLQADQNELLDELIKLGDIASSSSSCSITNGSDNLIGSNNNNDNNIRGSSSSHNNNCVNSRVTNGPCFDRGTRCSCISPHRADCSLSVATSCAGKVASSRAPCSSSSIVVPHLLSSQFCEPCYINNLRPIVIDGTNVAISHGKRDIFSCRGIRICVDMFRDRGHREISVLVPMWRKEYSRPDAPIIDQHILLELEKEDILGFTPSRSVNGQRINCHDDRFIIKLAAENGGIVVSNDKFQDLLTEYSTTNPNIEYQKVIKDRLLMYVFVNDLIMLPDDPLGRDGISLDRFLLREKGPCPHALKCHPSSVAAAAAMATGQPPACPYNKKCTYGNKCKYYHPERANQPMRSVTDRMAEQARVHLLDMKTRSMDAEVAERMKACHTASLPPTLQGTSGECGKRKTLPRTKSVIPSGHTCGQLQSPVATAAPGPVHDAMVSRACQSHKQFTLFQPGASAVASPHLKKNLPSSCKFSSNSCAELFAFDPHLNPQAPSCPSVSAEHLNLGKRFSDPVKAASQDSVITCNSYSLSEQGSPDSAIHQRQGSSIHLPVSSPHGVAGHFAQSALLHHQQLQASHSVNTVSSGPGARQHRKLARQLTLNPYESSNVFAGSTCERGNSSPSTGSVDATGLARRATPLLPDQQASDCFNAPVATNTCHPPVQAAIGSQRLHWSSMQAPIGCHRQQSLRRMRSDADSSPSVSSCSSFSMMSCASTSSNNPPQSATSGLDCLALLTQAREALLVLSKEDSFNRVFGDLVLLSMGEDGSLDAELTVDKKHCNGHGSLHEAFISGLMYTVSSLSFHIPLGVDFNSCATSSIVPSNSAGVNSCSCGTTIELSIAYLSLAKKGDVISLHCDVLKLENRLTFQQIEIFNKSNENKHIATGIHVISPN